MSRTKSSVKSAVGVPPPDFAISLADFGFLRQLGDDFIGIGTAVIVFPGVAVETAENAMVGAERDVQVGQGIFPQNRLRLLPPKPLPLT